MKEKPSNTIKLITTNRKAHYRFTIVESFEAGLILMGHEVKSLRNGQGNIQEAIVRIQNNEIFLFNAHISPYKFLTHIDVDPARTRKLLMHKKEIEKIGNNVQVQGLSLVPLELYFKEGVVKLTFGLGKGKNTRDRREEIKERDDQRSIRSV